MLHMNEIPFGHFRPSTGIMSRLLYQNCISANGGIIQRCNDVNINIKCVNRGADSVSFAIKPMCLTYLVGFCFSCNSFADPSSEMVLMAVV